MGVRRDPFKQDLIRIRHLIEEVEGTVTTLKQAKAEARRLTEQARKTKALTSTRAPASKRSS